MKKLLLILALAGCAGSAARGGVPGAAGASSDPRGLARFLRHDDVATIRISPQGTTLAAMSNASGETHVTFFSIADLKSVGGFRVGGTALFSRLEWATETRLVAQLDENSGGRASPVTYGELYAVNSDGTQEKLIFGYRASDTKTGSNISTHERIRAWGSIIDRMPNNPRNVLVLAQFWPEGVEPGAVEAYTVDVVTGRRVRVAAGPGQVEEYFTDENKEIRFAISRSKSYEREAYWRDNDEWTRLDKVAPLRRTAAKPVGFSAAKRTLYVVDEDERGPALFAVKLDSAERSIVVREPGVEPVDVLFDAKSGAPVAVQFVPDTIKWKILDGAHPLAKILKIAVEKLGELPQVISTTEDQKQAVVLTGSRESPGVFSLVRADGFVQPLLSMREGSAATAATTPISVRASDGVDIRGYLTMPKSPGPVPMVVLPHGGPHGVRDFGYDDEAQLFAAFGFATLRVNFRGSGGYGDAFEESGHRRWGDRVQDDIIEATRWAIDNKVADAKRIAIFGASFGGYSAVQSAIRAPDLFRCAVGYAGVYDLALMHEEGDVQETVRGRAALEKFIGSDAAELEKSSPVHNADKISVPVLLMHGEKDKRAPISHAKALCEAMRAAKKSCEEHYVANEMHGFFDLNNRIVAYERALAFIEKHTK